jgi:hypothetical protein
MVATGLVALSVLTGFVAALALQTKLDTTNGLADHREPLSAAAQQIYRSLSDADATASSAFLSGGSEPAQLRDRYEVDLAQAGAALAKAASDVGGIIFAEQQADTLGKQLPVYAGLVETARANNRLGMPIGAAYLREASTLMRSKILPAAQELYRIDIRRLTGEQDDATGFPWLTVVLTLVLLAALIVTQVYLTRRTNRLLNVSLLAATIAVGVGLIWGAVAVLVSASAVGDARADGSEQVDVLVQARIVALKGRADETLTLVARGDGVAYEKEFQDLSPTISGQGGGADLLTKARPPTRRAATTPSLAPRPGWTRTGAGRGGGQHDGDSATAAGVPVMRRVALLQGQVAAMSTDEPILAGMAAQDPNVKIVGPKLTEEPYGIGIPKANADMVRFVNAVLDKIHGDGSWQHSYDQWVGRRTGEPAAQPDPKYRD